MVAQIDQTNYSGNDNEGNCYFAQQLAREVLSKFIYYEHEHESHINQFIKNIEHAPMLCSSAMYKKKGRRTKYFYMKKTRVAQRQSRIFDLTRH